VAEFNNLDSADDTDNPADKTDNPADLDGLALRPPSEDAAPPLAAPPARRPTVAVALAILVLGAAGAWWWTDRHRVTSPPPPAVARETPPAVPASANTPPLPPLGQMDPFLRTLLGTLSAHPELVRWLATDDLIEQLAFAIDRIATGASPWRQLQVLRPTGSFVARGRTGAQTIDPASYRRFDGLAALVGSLDADRVAQAYGVIRPRLDEAYRALGRGASIDLAVSTALQTLIDTPSPGSPIRVGAGRGALYSFADPAIEALPAAQKQLLRMGPDNAARIRSKLQEIHKAISARTRAG
jgi:hypothetical protein